MISNKKVTISDVAELAELSEATVSRVLNNKQNVSPATRQAVLDVVEKLGYIHTPRTPTVEQKVKNIALCFGLMEHDTGLSPLLANGYFAEIVESVQSKCQDENINMPLMTIGPDFTSYENVQRVVDDGSVDAILFIRIMNPDVAEKLADLKIPAVLLGNYYPWLQMDTVNADAFNGMLLAMQYLLDNGHRNIAFIDGYPPPYNDYWVVMRKLAYQHMLEQYQIPYDDDLVAYGCLGSEQGQHAMQQILDSGKCFTAVLASNDSSAIRAIHTLQAANMDIPQDVSIIGHDDILELSNRKPLLTSLHVPKGDMGRAALDLLQARIQSSDRPIQHVLVAESLVVRKTVANVAGKKLQPINKNVLPFRR